MNLDCFSKQVLAVYIQLDQDRILSAESASDKFYASSKPQDLLESNKESVALPKGVDNNSYSWQADTHKSQHTTTADNQKVCIINQK